MLTASKWLMKASDNMVTTNDRLEKWILSIGTAVEGQHGQWRFHCRNASVYVVTDEFHNRMRIMTLVAEVNRLEHADLEILLRANFDRALDARYAFWKDHLWSVFAHPLAELSERQFLDAVEQVINLVSNYGSTYSSTDLVFGGEE